MHISLSSSFFFFFNDTATTEIYTLSLHDALPILRSAALTICCPLRTMVCASRTILTSCLCEVKTTSSVDRKSTRLNSSHSQISYAVFCLKKKKKKNKKILVKKRKIYKLT